MLFVALLLALLACKGGAAAGQRKFDVDADPFALLPPGAIAVSKIDAQALFASAGLGPRLGDLADKFASLADDAQFVPSRDVLHVITAVYATGDSVTILQGRFAASHIEAAQTTRQGAAMTHGRYAGHETSTTGPVSFAVLTPRTAVAATGDGLRRALDRVAVLEAEAQAAPSLPPWMVESFANRTPDAPPAIVVVADLATQPIAAATLATLKFPWLNGVQRATALVRVSESPTHPGLSVLATLTYADPARAEEAANGVRGADQWLTVLGPLLGGVDLREFVAVSNANDVRCHFAIDDRTLVTLLYLATKLTP